MRSVKLGLVCGLTAVATAVWADQNITRNGSMESGQGPSGIDPQVPASWTEFGENVERSGQYNLAPPDGGFSLKAFGDNTSNIVGAFQEILNVAPGQSVSASVWLYTASNDKLSGSGQAGLRLEFLNSFGGVVPDGAHETLVLNSGSPADQWIQASLVRTAPAGTAKVRFTCKLTWTPGDIAGACWWDDAQCTIDGGPNKVVNGDFETAGNSPGQSPAGLDEWQGFNDQEKSPLFARDAANSLQLGTRVAYSGLYQDMGVASAGDRILARAYAFVPSTDALNNTWRAGIKLEFLPNAQVPPPEENLAFDANDPQDTWTLVQLNTTVPPDMGIARVVMIWFADGGTNGAAHFDSAFAEVGSQPGVNQLLNSSFESGLGGPNGLDNWTEFYSNNVSEARANCFDLPGPPNGPGYHDGDCSCRATGKSVAGIYQEIPVTPGESLAISAYLLSWSGDPLTGTGKAGVKVEWAAGGIPPNIDIGPPGSPNTIGTGAATDTWIPLTVDFTMPDGTSATVRMTNIIEKGTATQGHVYIDGCETVITNRFDGADSDSDADEDMHDLANLQKAFAGAGVHPTAWPWLVFDSDEDSDLDTVNSEFFIPRLTGPN